MSVARRFFLPNVYFGPLARFYPPIEPRSPKAWPFHKVKEATVFQEFFQLPHAVAAELLVIEIDGVPNPLLAIEDIDSPGFRIPRHQQKQQNRRAEFDPANNLGILGHSYERRRRNLKICIRTNFQNGLNHHSTEHKRSFPGLMPIVENSLLLLSM
jgi:hypothetical protein